MQAELEVIENKDRSINYFKIRSPEFNPYWHFHKEYELTLITRGQGTRFVGNSVQNYEEGDLVLLGNFLPHQWVSSKTSIDNEAIVIQFLPGIFSNIPECSKLIDFLNSCKQGISFKGMSASLKQRLIDLEHYSGVEFLGKFLLILGELSEASEKEMISEGENRIAKRSLENQDKIDQTIKLLLKRANEKITLDEFAELNALTVTSFCRWFKKSLGVSFITYLNSVRVENACMDLLSTNEPIQAIAYANGFESPGHFNRIFKKFKGCSPGEFRKLNN